MKSFMVQPFAQRVSCTKDKKQFASRYNRNVGDGEKLTIAELDTCSGMAVYLDKRDKPPLFMIFLSTDCTFTLFHESLHMTHFIMSYCDAPINIESTETQAYLLEYIAKQGRLKLFG